MKSVLDTDICVFWLRGHKEVVKKLDQMDWEDILLSPITVAELYYGVFKSKRPETHLVSVDEFVSNCTVLTLNKETLLQFARIKVALESQGERLDDFDLMIASTAIVEGCPLATNNVRHFQRIPNLTIENWSIP